MKRTFKKIIFGLSPILLVGATLLTTKGEAATPPSPLCPVALAYWWGDPAKPEEKWLSPRREEDEWYKQRQKQKYRQRR